MKEMAFLTHSYVKVPYLADSLNFKAYFYIPVDYSENVLYLYLPDAVLSEVPPLPRLVPYLSHL